MERSSGKLCVIGRLMASKGYGSPPSLAPGQDDGSGWLTVRKYYLGVAGDTFIEPVKLTKAMSCAIGTRVTITHTDTQRGQRREFLISPDLEVVHQSNTNLCVTLGFSELLQSLTSVMLGKRMCSELYYNNTALHSAGIHRK